MSCEYEDDYEEEPSREEQEETNGCDSTTAKMKGNKLDIKVDFTDFVTGIVASVQGGVRKQLITEITSEIKREVLDGMRERIQLQSGEIIKSIIDEYVENEKITIGGNSFFDNEPLQTFTMKEYAKKCMADSVKNGKFRVAVGIEKDSYSRNKYRAKTQEYDFDEYIRSQLAIGNDVKDYIDKQVLSIKDDVNKNVKKAFDDSTRKMLSESVLNVLMANDTYKKIESNLACIADRTI